MMWLAVGTNGFIPGQVSETKRKSIDIMQVSSVRKKFNNRFLANINMAVLYIILYYIVVRAIRCKHCGYIHDTDTIIQQDMGNRLKIRLRPYCNLTTDNYSG